MKILYLTLKKQWFDMILSGEKTEEYREVKAYWTKRLLLADDGNRLTQEEAENLTEAIKYGFEDSWGDEALPKESYVRYNNVKFTNGYGGHRPSMTIEYIELRISRGKEEWGADPEKFYYVIKLGKLII